MAGRAPAARAAGGGAADAQAALRGLEYARAGNERLRGGVIEAAAEALTTMDERLGGARRLEREVGLRNDALVGSSAAGGLLRAWHAWASNARARRALPTRRARGQQPRRRAPLLALAAQWQRLHRAEADERERWRARWRGRRSAPAELHRRTSARGGGARPRSSRTSSSSASGTTPGARCGAPCAARRQPPAGGRAARAVARRGGGDGGGGGDGRAAAGGGGRRRQRAAAARRRRAVAAAAAGPGDGDDDDDDDDDDDIAGAQRIALLERRLADATDRSRRRWRSSRR